LRWQGFVARSRNFSQRFDPTINARHCRKDFLQNFNIGSNRIYTREINCVTATRLPGKGVLSRQNIIAIGASAGGVSALSSLLSDFPHPATAAFFVTLHVSSRSPSVLPQILSSASHLPAQHPKDMTPIKPGHIYVAPPDQHLLIEKSRIRLQRGPRENLQRPAIDPMFRSAAHAHGKRVAGVVLTGMLDDGASGLAEIQNCGGLAVVQDPAEAAFPDMPRNAIAAVTPDIQGPITHIRDVLIRIANSNGASRLDQLKVSPNRGNGTRSNPVRTMSADIADHMANLGPHSAFVCPECKGPLWETGAGKIPRYECLVGHAYTGNTLISANDGEIEKALWSALQILEQRKELQKRLAKSMTQPRQEFSRKSFLDKARKSEAQAILIRRLLEK
jgi:two-component system chemotaxis response regulator CheB